MYIDSTLATITDATQAKDVNSDPPIWRVYTECRGYEALFNIHADSPLEAIGILTRWEPDDIDPEAFSVSVNMEDKYLQLNATDRILVTSVTTEAGE